MTIPATVPLPDHAAPQRTPNFQLRSWRDQAQMTRNELADAINQSPTGRARHLVCDEERIRRWETGEVQWPSTDYRKALQEATGRDPHELGFRPRPATHGRTTQPVTSGTLRVELESRRHLLRQSISELQQELTFLDVILAVPDLGELLSR